LARTSLKLRKVIEILTLVGTSESNILPDDGDSEIEQIKVTCSGDNRFHPKKLGRKKKIKLEYKEVRRFQREAEERKREEELDRLQQIAAVEKRRAIKLKCDFKKELQPQTAADSNKVSDSVRKSTKTIKSTKKVNDVDKDFTLLTDALAKSFFDEAKLERANFFKNNALLSSNYAGSHVEEPFLANFAALVEAKRVISVEKMVWFCGLSCIKCLEVLNQCEKRGLLCGYFNAEGEYVCISRVRLL
jgi:hypothetical protein